MEKLYSLFIKNMFENGWWEDASPTSLFDLPLPERITMSPTTTPTSRFGFSMMRGKFCHSYFEITARTALAQFGHFTLKTRVRFQKGRGVDPLNFPWVRHGLGRSAKAITRFSPFAKWLRS